ncbi:MAG: hypothetical protein WBC44_11615 [Planctomycetaceae bacterium]
MPRTYKKKTDREYVSQKPQNLPTKFRTGFLSGLDKRTDLAKSLRANYETIVEDLGGRDDLSHVKAALVERFVWLEAILKTIEHDLVTGDIDKAEALGRWVQAVNSLSGLAKTLGIDRRSSARPWATVIPQEDDR